MRPDDAEHTFDAPSLSVPLTSGFQESETHRPDVASSSNDQEYYNIHIPDTAGESVPLAEVEELNQRRVEENDQAAWLEEDFVDEDDNLLLDADLEVEENRVTGGNT